MRIERLEFHDQDNDWQLEEASFGKLSLLVGVSSAGKTKILGAINSLSLIASGHSFSGMKWDVHFSVENGATYRWKGEFQQKSTRSYKERNGDDGKARLSNEALFVNGKTIAERTGTAIRFEGTQLPKLSQEESLLKLLMEEPSVKMARDGFGKIIFPLSTEDFNLNFAPVGSINEWMGNHYDISSIREITGSRALKTKLFLASRDAREVFDRIVQKYTEIFPLVEAVRLEIFPNSDVLGMEPILYMKESHVKNWIHQVDMSQGMLKALLLIAEIHLCPNGSVILIDEFENSLGINCIDEVTSALMSPGRDLQFIITSHHPFIINNIDMEYWKVVTRHGGKVKVLDAADLNLGKSRHAAFTQLINLEAYRTGIAS